MARSLALSFSLFVHAGVVPAGVVEGWDPYTHFFNARSGDLEAGLANARGACRTLRFARYKQ